MNAEVIDDWQRVFALEAEWNGLVRESRANAIFLTWEWIRSWVAVAGESVRPFVVAVRDSSGALAGLAPFYVGHLRLGGLIPYRTLRVMADYATGSDYPDWIARRDCETEATRAIVEALARNGRHWDCIWMPKVAGWTGARERIVSACNREAFYCHVRPRDFAYVELPADMEAYMKALSYKRRQIVRQQIRKVMGRSDIAITRCETTEELPRLLKGLFDLHYRRWSEKGEDGTFRRKPSEARFYELFTPVALKNGWLRLFGFEEHGQLKAVQIGYVYDNVFHAMQEGFDPNYVKGVGNVLRAKVIEACIAQGVEGMDFLAGMTEHKRWWLSRERIGYDLFIGRRSLKNRLLFSREVWPTGRFMRQEGLPDAVDGFLDR